MPKIKNVGVRPYTINHRGGFDKAKNTPIVKKFKFPVGDEVSVTDDELELLREHDLFNAAVDGRNMMVTEVKEKENDKGETVFVKEKTKVEHRPDLLVKDAKPAKSTAEKKKELAEKIQALCGEVPKNKEGIGKFRAALEKAELKADEK